MKDNDTVYLVTRADDIGCSHAANVACMKVFTSGICRSVELMPNCPWFPEAVQMLNEYPGYDVGVHLTLTSEWDNMKWGPLTHAPSLTTSDGYFPCAHIRDKGRVPDNRMVLAEMDWKLAEVESEMRAQIETTLKHVPYASHSIKHMGNNRDVWGYPEIDNLIRELNAEYGLEISLTELGYENVSLFPKVITSTYVDTEEYLQRFLDFLDNLKPGKWLSVIHPGLNVPEMQAMSHLGYEYVAAQRQADVDVWTHPKVIEKVEQRGIQLLSYKDVAAMI